MFIDELTIQVRAGKGGRGCISFRREKFVPRGGPDGGNGGRGGYIIFVADENLNTLYHLTHFPLYAAENGEAGGPKNCSGKNGRDLILRVPVGTIIRDIDKKLVIKDLKKSGEQAIVAFGGKGGRGNKVFATPTNQTPRHAEKGEPGEERQLYLELKLIADVGIVGLPNAGKSTLLSRLSAARPKIADYPFTTLHPYLGIVHAGKFKTFVIADLPGLIEGAHAGAGLGDKFLKHIERTRMILHLVDVSPYATQPPKEAYLAIRKELASYSTTLSEKPEIVVANKLDMESTKKGLTRLIQAVPNNKILSISALQGKGLRMLIHELAHRLQDLSAVPSTCLTDRQMAQAGQK